MRKRTDVQGYFLGIPYDFRCPTLAKAKNRFWNHEDSMLLPKIWGWGWELNFAHKGTWFLLAVIRVSVIIAVLV